MSGKICGKKELYAGRVEQNMIKVEVIVHTMELKKLTGKN